MKYREAVFVVTYSTIGNKIYYLILKRKLHWKGWEFPKGGMKFLETKKHAVKRELKEETGLKPLKIKKFNIKGQYNYHKEFSDRPGINGQNYTLFAVETRRGKVKLDKLEHSDYKWMNFNEATKKVTWTNQKKCLKVVDSYLLNEI
ncbi:MAG: NUDIX domain-containing protein [archaeon]|nr:NUDIX domain-containing protein [archaeon]